MWRAPRRWAPFTCTSPESSPSSITSGSGRVASPSARARNPRSTAATVAAMESLSRNASSGTTRISVGEHPPEAPLRLRQRLLEVLQLLAVAEPEVVGKAEVLAGNEQHAVLGAHLLHELQRAHRLAVLHEADRPRLRRLPAEGVAEALEPLLEHRIVGLEDAPRALEQLVPHPGLERHGGEVVRRAGGADRGVVVPRPRLGREGWRGDDPADAQARQAVGLGETVHRDHPLVATPEGGRRLAIELRALVHLVGEEPGAHLGRAFERSEEHTSELQSPCNLVCRLLLEKKNRTRPGRWSPCSC